MASFMSGMAGNVTAFNTVWTYDIYQSFRDPPVLLKPGDVYEVAIERLGTLRTPWLERTTNEPERRSNYRRAGQMSELYQARQLRS